MKSREDILTVIEKMHKSILSPATKMNIREKLVNQTEILQWVLEDKVPKIEKRLKDAGIITDNEEAIEAE